MNAPGIGLHVAILRKRMWMARFEKCVRPTGSFGSRVPIDGGEMAEIAVFW